MVLVPTTTFPKESRDTGVPSIVIGTTPGRTVSVVNMMGCDIVSKPPAFPSGGDPEAKGRVTLKLVEHGVVVQFVVVVMASITVVVVGLSLCRDANWQVPLERRKTNTRIVVVWKSEPILFNRKNHRTRGILLDDRYLFVDGIQEIKHIAFWNKMKLSR